MDNTADAVLPFALAKTEADTVEVTFFVFIINVTDVEPAATVAEAGAIAADCPTESATFKPPLGAGAFNVTLPSELLPPLTEVGVRMMACTVGGSTVNTAL